MDLTTILVAIFHNAVAVVVTMNRDASVSVLVASVVPSIVHLMKNHDTSTLAHTHLTALIAVY
jgi:hypothetical protein